MRDLGAVAARAPACVWGVRLQEQLPRAQAPPLTWTPRLIRMTPVALTVKYSGPTFCRCTTVRSYGRNRTPSGALHDPSNVAKLARHALAEAGDAKHVRLVLCSLAAEPNALFLSQCSYHTPAQPPATTLN